MEKISICISAYKVDCCIEECLNSIRKQSLLALQKNYEILIGIDGCEKTLEKLKSIAYKYDNLRLFMMDSNAGAFITMNTLLNIADGDIIQRFDADDIMDKQMMAELYKFIKIGYDIVQPECDYLINNLKIPRGTTVHGPVMFRKKILEKLGGYSAWKCKADTDFVMRARKHPEIKDGKNRRAKMLYRKERPEQLTSDPLTDNKSEIRALYTNIMNSNLEKNKLYVEPVLNSYVEIV